MIEGGLRRTEGCGGDGDASRIKRGHRNFEPFAFAANEVCSRYLTILEKDLASEMRQAHRPLTFPEGQTGGSLLDDKRTDSFCAFSFFSNRHHDIHIGLAAVSYPDFLTTKDVFVTSEFSPCVDVRSVYA